MENIGQLFLVIIYGILFLFFANIFFNIILLQYKKKSGTIDLHDTINLLNDIISLYLTLYNDSVFSQINQLSATEITNYTKEICKDIANSLSDELVENISRMMSEEAMYLYISKKVQVYLHQKNNP